MTTGLHAKSGRPLKGPRALRAYEPPLPVTYVSNRVRIGLHGRNDAEFTETDFRIIREAKIETLKTMSQTKVEVYQRLRAEFPYLEFIVRLYDERIGVRRHPAPADFVAKFVPVMKALQPFVAKFEIHNEPNHQDLYEGWGPTLEDARDFNAWFLEVFRGLKTACPWAQLGFPGLAPHHGGWNNDLAWIKECAEAVRVADWLGVHTYWQQNNHLSFDWGLHFTEYHKLFPDKKLEITEFGDSTPGLDRNTMADKYAEYYQAIQPYGVYVRSACSFIATSPDNTWKPFFWGDPDTGQVFPVVAKVGAIPRTKIVPEGPIDTLTGMKDWRGLLPTRERTMPYDKRDVKGISYIVIHHSTGSSTLTAPVLAKWDVTQTEKDPYPEITYHFVIDADGTIERCHSLDVLAWHAGDRRLPAPGGVSINNWKGVAICLVGNFMGGVQPTNAQLQSAARLCKAILQIVPNATIVGHRDIVPAGGTSCPGDTWAPATGGGYRDKLLALITGMPAGPAYAYTLAHQTPATIQSGDTITVPVTVKNTGSKTWIATGTNAVHLSYHWANTAGKVVIFDGERTPLPGNISPGQEVTLQATVKAPPDPGNYVLQWDLVEEFITWFSQQGAPVVTANVTVTAPEAIILRATASIAAAEAALALDGNPDTAWNTGQPQQHGTWFQIDLGTLCLVSGLKAQSPNGLFPRGFAINVSRDGKSWTEIARYEDNHGDVDVTFPATKARYVRLDLILPPWAISNVTVNAQALPVWKVTASHNATDAAKAIDGDPATAWSTGVGQVPGMWFQLDMGVPQRVKAIALAALKNQDPRGYIVSVSLDGQTWQEVAKKALNYQPVTVTLGLPLIRYVRVETTATDRYNHPWSITELTVETTPQWQASASHNSEKAGLAIDGLFDTFWTTGQAQVPGMWFKLDLGEPLKISKVRLEGPEKEFPRGLAVSVSTDGQSWTEAGRVERFYRGPVEVSFPTPMLARFIRLEQTSDVVQAGKWNLPWSISEISVFTA